MEKIYDIYDCRTFRLVKADVTLGVQSGSHKDLTKNRYVKERVGNKLLERDFDAMAIGLALLQDQINDIYRKIDELIDKGDNVPTTTLTDENIKEITQFYQDFLVKGTDMLDDDLPF